MADDKTLQYPFGPGAKETECRQILERARQTAGLPLTRREKPLPPPTPAPKASDSSS